MDTNTKEEQHKNEHEIWNTQDKQVQNSSIYNPLCFNHLNSCTILHEYLPKPVYLVYHTHALHTYQKAGNFETNNILRK
jgi:hypothetical protein